jgi:hypothetical protein
VASQTPFGEVVLYFHSFVKTTVCVPLARPDEAYNNAGTSAALLYPLRYTLYPPSTATE